MRRYHLYLLTFVTFICCVPFLWMFSSYLRWKQSNPSTVGADIGLGMVVLSAYLMVIPLLLWICYGLIVLFRPQPANADQNTSYFGSYFGSRRRRISVALLVVACVLSMGWVRSYYTVDKLGAFGGTFESHNGIIDRSSTEIVSVGQIGTGMTTLHWSIPYLLLVLPLTLLSGWLLLSKPRATKRIPIPESKA